MAYSLPHIHENVLVNPCYCRYLVRYKGHCWSKAVVPYTSNLAIPMQTPAQQVPSNMLCNMQLHTIVIHSRQTTNCMYSIFCELCAWLCCDLFCYGSVWVVGDSGEMLIYILQCYFTGTWGIIFPVGNHLYQRRPQDTFSRCPKH